MPDDSAERSQPREEFDRRSQHGSVVGDLRQWGRRTLEVLRGTSIPVDSYDPSVHSPLITHSGPDDLEEIERYWLNAPYAMAVISRDPEKFEHRYHTVEPTLSDIERRLLERLEEEVREPILYREQDGREPQIVLREELRKRLEEYGVDISPESFFKLYYYLYRDFRGYGKIDPLLHDPYIEDISCNGNGLPIYVYHSEYTDIRTDISFERSDLDRYLVKLAQRSGRHISAGDPIVETTLPDGSRAELSLGEQVTPRGSSFTIRKYAADPFTPINLIDLGTFSIEQMAYLWLAIENNKNLIFAGGTASGKTTSMNAVSMFIPPRSKVVTIEDTRELTLHHENWLSSVTRERIGEERDITMYDLLRSGLRHRPEYIIVGEIRGEEALTMFQAMNTGHTTYTTMHADSVQTVINRLENEPINTPRQMIEALDILCIQLLTRRGEERVRRNRQLAEINEIDNRTGELSYSEKFEWRPESDEFTHMLGTSEVLDDIRESRGWSHSDLQRELRNRRWVLEFMWENDITDYRQFTSVVNEYYSEPDRVLKEVTASGIGHELSDEPTHAP